MYDNQKKQKKIKKLGSINLFEKKNNKKKPKI
jgi:hypothetical protein